MMPIMVWGGGLFAVGPVTPVLGSPFLGILPHVRNAFVLQNSTREHYIIEPWFYLAESEDF